MLRTLIIAFAALLIGSIIGWKARYFTADGPDGIQWKFNDAARQGDINEMKDLISAGADPLLFPSYADGAVTGAPAAELKYPRMTTERILSAQPNKFRDIELVRDYQEGEITSYRWLIHDGRRDRRGPGKYVNRSHCILYAPARHAKVVKETADEFDLVIELSEYDQESTIRITVKRRSPDVANAWVRIDGKGEIYDEFVAQVDAVQKGADEVLWEGEEGGEHVPKGSGNMLRWFYLAQPKGRVID